MSLATALKGAWPTPVMVHTNRGQPRGLTINPVNSREFAKGRPKRSPRAHSQRPDLGVRASVGHVIPVVFLVLSVTIMFALYTGLVQISSIVP